MKLKQDYYLQTNVLALARDLIGKMLFTKLNEKRCSGIITETEAYAGEADRASHAFAGRRTLRNEQMYGVGGTGYVYYCYGIHALFNIVSNQKNIPHAVLIRAIKPVEGIDEMLLRRGKSVVDKSLSTGPGSVSKALGIQIIHNGISLLGNKIWLEDQRINIPQNQVKTTPRIGVESAKEAALYPYRFVVNNAAI